MEKKGNNKIELTTKECPISSVTVFKHRAEVCRMVDTSVMSGVNELCISGFVDIEEDSIRVVGKGKATIAEVSFQAKQVGEEEKTSNSEKEKALEEELKALNEQKKQLDPEAQSELLKKQWSVLDQFATNAAKAGQGSSTDGKPATVQLDEAYFKGMKDFLMVYKDMGKELDADKLELKRKTEELNNKIQKVQTNLTALRGNNRKTAQQRECIVILEATEDSPVQLKLSYVVYGAKWVPLYDLRMNTEDGLLMVSYFGLISQNSGEDWTEVQLHLSTAEPSVGGVIPDLPKTQVSIMKPKPKPMPENKRGFRDIGGSMLRSLRAPPMMMMSPEPMLDLECEMDYTEVEVQETTVSASYEISRLSSIPSDNTPHKVTIGICELKPTMTYITLPKAVPRAFLQAKVVNTSRFTFLPGKTNIFLNNSFVAKAEIKAVAPKEEFECSLGVDPGVRVTYKPLVKVNSSSGGLLYYKTKTISHEQGIEVKNVHSYPINITIKEDLPRSCDQEIKIALQSPYIDSKPERSEATLSSENEITWELEVKAQETKEVFLKYTIEYPAAETLELN